MSRIMENKLEHCCNLEEISVEDIDKVKVGCIKQEIDTFIHEKNDFQENVSNEISTKNTKECIVIKVEQCENSDNESQALAENDEELERYKQLTLNEDGKSGAFPEIYKSALHRESQENMHEKNQCSAEPLQFYIEVELNDDRKCEENMTIKREKVEYEELSQPTNDELEQYSESIIVKVECHYSDEELVEEPADEVNGPACSGENQENTDTRRTTANGMYQDTRLIATRQTLHKFNSKQRRQKFKTTKAFANTLVDYEDAVHDEITQDVYDIRKKRVHSTNNSTLVGDKEESEIDANIYYKCDICGYVTVTKKMLESHMKLHYVNQFSSDDECKFWLRTNTHLEKYKQKNISDKSEIQDEGSSKTRRISKGPLKQVSRSRTDKCLLYACHLCSYKGTQKTYLKRHMLTHTSDKPYSCDLCPYKSARESDVKRHALTHTGDKSYPCPLCPYKSARKSYLKQHISTHTGDKPYACNLCPYKSTQKANLKQHLLTHTGDKPYSCDLCPYKSARESDLKRHTLTHTGDKSYACDVCPYKCARRSYLKQHMLTHTGEKHYDCNLCPYKSARRSNLKQHILSHTGEKHYACNLCSYKTAYESDLKRHILTHTGEKRYACELCSYKTAQKSNLNQHMSTHTGKKRYACNLCPYEISWKSSLRQHIKRKHGCDEIILSSLRKDS